MQPLVSIIIPTYNRAHLIGETLDSIIAQTYQNWECVIVDDGSTDDTDTIMAAYIEKDNRFQYYHRPKIHLPGGNGARNYGLEQATGTYVIFFDSDDLMTLDHIQVKVEALLKQSCDYVIAKTKFFNSLDPWIERMYEGVRNGVTAEKFILQQLSWLTYDACIKADLAKSIDFNESLRSGQEFNYFSKLVLKSVDAVFIEKYLTLRRVHDDSIRGTLPNKDLVTVSAYTSCWYTYKDIHADASPRIRKGLLMRCIDMLYKCPKIKFPHTGALAKTVFREFGVWSSISFLCMRFLNTHFKKGYYFRKVIAKKYEKTGVTYN
ncbi:MAG: hypothetical protein CMC13_08425 [Flavobacteriaceae bacterium]|nr:hypothetical protein [Flavobacteriaceae bacterium]|tara:strand:+ start:99 stop:1058 length:960 start_codon:yes stop_codon:yes gene_type:complete